MNDTDKAYLDMKRRDIALKYACTQYSKTKLTVDEEKIASLAKRFLKFLETGA